MRNQRNSGIIVSVQVTSIKKGIIVLILSFMMIFSMIGLMTSLKPAYRITSSSINEMTTRISGQALIQLLAYENHYFSQAKSNDHLNPKMSALLFEIATSINLDDPRSLLGKELPGFSIFDGKIIIAGKGTNYTNMPIESSPPLEVLLAEREASLQNLEQLDKPMEEKPAAPPALSTGERKVVYIYHTHSRESYFPHLKDVDTSNPNNASHSQVNVTMVGDMLGAELTNRGIGTEVNKDNLTEKLVKKGWKYAQSYELSGQVVESAMASNRELAYFIDIHRDSQRQLTTTVTINGEPYAKIAFIIGSNNSNYEKNLKIAEDLHKALEQSYPGISRGVFKQGGPGNNGVYNQDKSENAMLIEFGGVDNNFEELRRTAQAIASVFADYYWQAEKVNGQPGEQAGSRQ